jgi:hypothetical protein
VNQRTRLARPFPARYVKKPPQGKYGSYVPHDVITQALLAILGPFDLEIGEPILGPTGKVEGVLVTIRTTIDGTTVAVTEAGDCENPDNWKTQGARLKDCISDGLKRCAMRLGLGLHLWSGDDYFLFQQLSSPAAGDPVTVEPSRTVPAAPKARQSKPAGTPPVEDDMEKPF